MKPIKQPAGTKSCGQACVAMLLNISLSEALNLFGFKGPTYGIQLRKVLNENGIKTSNRTITVRKNTFFLPDVAILKITYKGKHLGHWVLKYYNKIYCPNYGVYKSSNVLKEIERDLKLWKCDRITSYVKITSKDKV